MWWDDAQLVEGTARHLRHVCGLHQHGQGKIDNRKLEPVGLLRKKISMVWGVPPDPGIISISITCPFLGGGGTVAWAAPERRSGTGSEAVMVWQKPLSPHCRVLHGVRPPSVHPAKVCRWPLLGSVPLPCLGQATGAVWSILQ